MQVAGEQERPPHLHPALLPRAQWRSVEVDDADLHAGERVAVALDELLLRVAGDAQGDQRVLALPPAAEHGQAGQPARASRTIARGIGAPKSSRLVAVLGGIGIGVMVSRRTVLSLA